MARDVYNNVIGRRDPLTGNFEPLNNVQITVEDVNDGNATATIYQARTGASQGPSPNAGATGTNPFTTGVSGAIEFWAESGEYDLQVHDLEVPARVADVTLGFSASPFGPGDIPSDRIAGDGALPLASLGAAVLRQLPPLGTVIEWWRPSISYNAGGGAGQPPSGWVLCDGSTISVANHDFGTGSSIVVPDLRNTFILGADNAKANGVAGVSGSDAAGDGPGIAGAGGSNVRSFSHSHTVNSHSHGGLTTANGLTTNAAGDHNHSIKGNTGGVIGLGNVINYTAGGTWLDHYHAWGGTSSVAGNHAHSVNPHNHGIIDEAPGMNSQLSSTQDIRPRHVGLLRLMKVKRS